MIILALIFIGEGEGASAKELPWFDFGGLPNLFGVTIYSFMCHHRYMLIVMYSTY